MTEEGLDHSRFSLAIAKKNRSVLVIMIFIRDLVTTGKVVSDKLYDRIYFSIIRLWDNTVTSKDISFAI